MLVDLLKKIRDWADARFLKLTGGTLTGYLYMDNGAVDRDGTVSSEKTANRIMFRDKDDERIGELRVSQYADGRTGLLHGVVNEKTDGSEVANWFTMYVAKDGAATYSVTSPANFRSAISTLSAVNANGYWGMGRPDGNTSDYIRTTQNGIIPYQSNGSGSVGTTAWPFSYMHSRSYSSRRSEYNASTTPSGSLWLNAVEGRDSNDVVRFTLRQVAHSDGYQGVQLEGVRLVNNSPVYNGLRMEVNASGARRVVLTDASAWRAAISCHARYTQLYYNATGTDGTVTLSASAANYPWLRIYFKKNGDASACDSTDVYAPNGKKVSLTVFNYSGSTHQIMAKVVTISGTSITKTAEGYMYWGANNGGWGCNNTDTTLYIYRVDGWTN